MSETETRSVTEPAGALALAGLKRHIIDNQLIGSGKKFVAVISGANMNFDRLRFVAERAELGEGKEALLSVDIPEHPGRYATHVPRDIVPNLSRDTMSSPSSVFLLFTRLYTLARSRNSYTGTMPQTVHTSSCRSSWKPPPARRRSRACLTSSSAGV